MMVRRSNEPDHPDYSLVQQNLDSCLLPHEDEAVHVGRNLEHRSGDMFKARWNPRLRLFMTLHDGSTTANSTLVACVVHSLPAPPIMVRDVQPGR